jgi:hypothetical protein
MLHNLHASPNIIREEDEMGDICSTSGTDEICI